jgi:hypothetical protein
MVVTTNMSWHDECMSGKADRLLANQSAAKDKCKQQRTCATVYLVGDTEEGGCTAAGIHTCIIVGWRLHNDAKADMYACVFTFHRSKIIIVRK